MTGPGEERSLYKLYPPKTTGKAVSPTFKRGVIRKDVNPESVGTVRRKGIFVETARNIGRVRLTWHQTAV